MEYNGLPKARIDPVEGVGYSALRRGAKALDVTLKYEHSSLTRAERPGVLQHLRRNNLGKGRIIDAAGQAAGIGCKKESSAGGKADDQI
jgi:hypothetical protein